MDILGTRFVLTAVKCFVIALTIPAFSNTQVPPETVQPSSAGSRTAKDIAEDEPHFSKGMKYRVLGPFRGGRSLTASGVSGDPATYYFGSTGGGVWKSTNDAISWTPIFDTEGVGSIGSLAVSQSDPNVIYVGTGEACIRGDISHGDGMYKSV